MSDNETQETRVEEKVSTKVLEAVQPYLLRSVELLVEQLRESPPGYCLSVQLTPAKHGGECRIEAGFVLKSDKTSCLERFDDEMQPKYGIFIDIGVDVPLEKLLTNGMKEVVAGD